MVFFTIVIVVLYGVATSIYNKKERIYTKKNENSNIVQVEENINNLKEELAKLKTPEYIYKYILNVIENGSKDLGFPGGIMEGGYVSKDDAPKIACYVLELGGHHCPHKYSKDAQMYFSSVCAGCHGIDAKGIHGNYPDLTRLKLLGILKKEEKIKSKLLYLKEKNRKRL